MNLQTEQTEQKLRGGYYTPQPIASYLWELKVESTQIGFSPWDT